MTKDDFKRILTEPKNALTKQYQALLATDGVSITFTDEAIEELASYAEQINMNTDNIGARRLHTILETLLEELLFDAADMQIGEVEINGAYVRERLDTIAGNQDLSHYIL